MTYSELCKIHKSQILFQHLETTIGQTDPAMSEDPQLVQIAQHTPQEAFDYFSQAFSKHCIPRAPRKTQSCETAEAGFIMVAMVIMLLPLTLIVAAFISSMGGRSFRLREEVVQEKAFLAAESGLDEAIYRAQTTGLTDGGIFARAFGKGMAFSVEPTYLGGDGIDNDSK